MTAHHPDRSRIALILTAVALTIAAAAAQQSSAPGSPSPQQPSDLAVVINGDPGTPPRYAVPDFVALSPDAAAEAKTLGEVLWNDLNYERELYMIPRDTYSTVPAARTADQVPFASWRELGADAVVFGTVQKSGTTVTVQVRLFNVRTRQSVFSKEYTGSNPRLVAHTASDEIFLQQRALKGVARTKLAFTSDRNRQTIAGPIKNRDVKEIYIADYDGANSRRITTSRDLNITPVWSPDAKAIAYTSYRRVVPDIFVSLIYQGIKQNPT
jgi:TolB protein